MIDLHDSFAQLDDIETEDLWSEIEFRFEQDVDRVPYPVPRPRRRLAVAGAAAVIVAILIGVAFLLRSFQEDTPPIITQPSNITSLPAPTSTIPSEPSTTVTTFALAPESDFVWAEVSDDSLTGGKEAYGITLYNNTYLMVGADRGDGAVWRSGDGLTWTQTSNPGIGGPGDQILKDVVVYSDGLVAVGESINLVGDEYFTAPLIAISNDGSTWGQVDTEDEDTFPGDGWISSVTVLGDRLIAAGSEIWISDNGHDWTLSLDLSDAHRAFGVAASELGIVVVGQSFNNISDAFARWSADGSEWTVIPGPTLHPDGLNTFMYTVAATSDGFIAGGGASYDSGTASGGGLGASDAAIWISEDGLAWDLTSDDDEQLGGSRGQWINGFADTGDVLIGVGVEMAANWDNALGVVWESTDGGMNWRRVTDPDSVFGDYLKGWNSLDDVLFHNNTLIAAGNRPDDAAGVWVGLP